MVSFIRSVPCTYLNLCGFFSLPLLLLLPLLLVLRTDADVNRVMESPVVNVRIESVQWRLIQFRLGEKEKEKRERQRARQKERKKWNEIFLKFSFPVGAMDTGHGGIVMMAGARLGFEMISLVSIHANN